MFSVFTNRKEVQILNKNESLVTKLTTSILNVLIMIDAVIEKYNDNKEWFTEHAQADFLKIE